jgi:hypothetical protein
LRQLLQVVKNKSLVFSVNRIALAVIKSDVLISHASIMPPKRGMPQLFANLSLTAFLQTSEISVG